MLLAYRPPLWADLTALGLRRAGDPRPLSGDALKREEIEWRRHLHDEPVGSGLDVPAEDFDHVFTRSLDPVRILPPLGIELIQTRTERGRVLADDQPERDRGPDRCGLSPRGGGLRAER